MWLLCPQMHRAPWLLNRDQEILSAHPQAIGHKALFAENGCSLLRTVANALSLGFDCCLSYFSTSFLTADLFLDFLFMNSDILSLPTLVMPDNMKCLPCPCLPTLLRGWFTSYCSLVMQPTCFHPPCACGPGELRLLSHSVSCHRCLASPSTTTWTRAS